MVKCSTGDLTDVNNYRAIAISNSMSKILETVLYNFIECNDKTDNYQFGFRKNHSIALCTHVFKQTVNHYVQRGSHVFCAFYYRAKLRVARYCHGKLSVRPSVCPSVRPSVTLRYRDHIGSNSWKIISRLISLTSSLFADPNVTNQLQREHPQILAGIGVG